MLSELVKTEEDVVAPSPLHAEDLSLTNAASSTDERPQTDITSRIVDMEDVVVAPFSSHVEDLSPTEPASTPPTDPVSRPSQAEINAMETEAYYNGLQAELAAYHDGRSPLAPALASEAPLAPSLASIPRATKTLGTTSSSPSATLESSEHLLSRQSSFDRNRIDPFAPTKKRGRENEVFSLQVEESSAFVGVEGSAKWAKIEAKRAKVEVEVEEEESSSSSEEESLLVQMMLVRGAGRRAGEED